MRNLKFVGLVALAVLAVALLTNKSSAAVTTTDTTLGIRTGTFTFYKDITGGNASATIDIGNYDPSLAEIAAASAGDHRFAVSDMLGLSFTITLQSSDLTATNGTVLANRVSYTGSAWAGTGKALTAAPTSAADLSSPVTYVARTNNDGLSYYTQDITLKVQVPAAQAPGSYTGLLTFTY